MQSVAGTLDFSGGVLIESNRAEKRPWLERQRGCEESQVRVQPLQSTIAVAGWVEIRYLLPRASAGRWGNRAKDRFGTVNSTDCPSLPRFGAHPLSQAPEGPYNVLGKTAIQSKHLKWIL